MTTMLLGFCGLALRFCLKSKCEHCNICWGCLKIHRRVELEENVQENDEEQPAS
jgi:hypothetical protein